MLSVKVTKAGVFIVNEANKLYVAVYENPKQLQEFIDQLQEAKVRLVEHQGRSAEDGNMIWESV